MNGAVLETMINTTAAVGQSVFSTSKTVLKTVIAVATSHEAKLAGRFTLLLLQLIFWAAVWLGATAVVWGQRFRRYYDAHHEEYSKLKTVVAKAVVKGSKAVWRVAKAVIEFIATVRAIAEVEAELKARQSATKSAALAKQDLMAMLR